MTNTQIGNTVTVTTNPVLDYRVSVCREIAVDLLQGCSDNYVFFYNGSGQLSTNSYWQQYVLVVGDLTSWASTGQFVFSDCTVYQIYCVRTSVLPLEYFTFSGNEIASDGSISSITLDGTSRRTDFEYKSAYYFYEKSSVTINYSSGDMVYSSLDDFPHLIDGGEFYGFASCCLLCIGFGFMLISRIFRRLY